MFKRIAIPLLLALLLPLFGCTKDNKSTPGGGAGGTAKIGQDAPKSALSNQQEQQLQALLRYIPKRSEAVFFLPRLAHLPTQIDLFLKRVEGIRKNDDLRRYLMALQNQIGINPLDSKSLQDHGLALEGSFAATRYKHNNRNLLITAFHVANTKTFQEKIAHILSEKLMASDKKSQKAKEIEITTYYSKGMFQQPSEEISLAAVGKDIILAAIDMTSKGVPDPEGSKEHTRFGAQALESLLGLATEASFQGNPTLQEAMRKQGDSLLFVYSDLADVAKSIAAQQSKKARPTGIRPLGVPFGNLPLNPSALAEKIPMRWGVSSLQLDKDGATLRSHLAITPEASKLLKSLHAQSGDASKLAQAIHSSALLTLKGSMDAQSITQHLEALAKKMNLQLDTLYAQFTKLTGLDLKKDVIAQIAGHGYISLYNVESNILQEWTQRYRMNPFFLPRYLQASVIGQIRDPKALEATLTKIASSFKLGKESIKSEKKDGRIVYSLEAWPGAHAFWTIVGDTFIYSLGQKAFDLTLAAHQGKERFFNAQLLPALQRGDTQGGFIDLANLQKMLQRFNLPFSVRLLLGTALQQIQGIRRVSLTATTAQDALLLEGRLDLGSMQ
jgi:hypothetical protein